MRSPRQLEQARLCFTQYPSSISGTKCPNRRSLRTITLEFVKRLGHVAAIAALLIGALAGPVTASSVRTPYVGAETRTAPFGEVPFTVLGSGIVDTSDRYLVQFANDTSRQRGRFAFLGRGLNADSVTDRSTFVLAVDATASEVEGLRQLPGVVAVEPEQLFELLTDQPSPPWGLDRIDQRHLPLDSNYSYGATGSGVDIYVIDSGLWFTHTEFTGRIPRYAFFDYGDGLAGWDCHGHGTHVAGIAAGNTYGVAKGASIVPVKVSPCTDGAATSILLGAIDWIVDDHVSGTPAVVNISLGHPPSSILDSAVQSMIDDGITVVAAAGNEATNSCWSSPGRLASAITVAASTSDDDYAWYSNYGSCNDLFAPGSGIVSAWVGWDSASQTLYGTSMAAPHVAGAAALVLQNNPSYSPSQVWAALDANATRGALTECCGDPDKLLYIPPSVVAPSGASITLGSVTSSSMAATFSANDGGGTNSYTLTIRTPNAGGAVVQTLTNQTSPATISGLSASTPYSVTVTADNGVAPAATAEASASTLPPSVVAPSGASITLGSVTSSSMVATFSAADGGGTNSYTLSVWMWTPGVGGAVVQTLANQTSPLTISGLSASTAYSVTVTAANGVAPAATAEASATTPPPAGPSADPRQAAFDEFAATPGLHRGHSTILRLYWAVFARVPDVGGSEFWVNSYDSGEWSTRRIANHFVVSREFVETYGTGLTNEQFARLVYGNVLEREPDSGGLAFWIGQLDGGMERSEMILLTSNAPEFIGLHPLPSDSVADTGPRG